MPQTMSSQLCSTLAICTTLSQIISDSTSHLLDQVRCIQLSPICLGLGGWEAQDISAKIRAVSAKLGQGDYPTGLPNPPVSTFSDYSNSFLRTTEFQEPLSLYIVSSIVSNPQQGLCKCCPSLGSWPRTVTLGCSEIFESCAG